MKATSIIHTSRIHYKTIADYTYMFEAIKKKNKKTVNLNFGY